MDLYSFLRNDFVLKQFWCYFSDLCEFSVCVKPCQIEFVGTLFMLVLIVFYIVWRFLFYFNFYSYFPAIPSPKMCFCDDRRRRFLGG